MDGGRRLRLDGSARLLGAATAGRRVGIALVPGRSRPYFVRKRNFGRSPIINIDPPAEEARCC